ncbi:MAG: hypothetical protein O3A00_22805, partial [Planctomycetota bacterium]|nr:hypothetical protein [Planctomycetota bacterium]
MPMQSIVLGSFRRIIGLAVVSAGIASLAFAQPDKPDAAPGYGDDLEKVVASAIAALEDGDHSAFVDNMFPPSSILQAGPRGAELLAGQFK